MDGRGFFSRLFDSADFAEQGLRSNIDQGSISYNPEPGTLRGLHYQVAPHEEAKLVRCIRGSVFDVAVDLRPDSASYLRSVGFHLNESNRLAVYVPEGVAHGFLTLSENAELSYNMFGVYVAAAARGVRWDDPALNIQWPDRPRVISDNDATWPWLHSATSR